MKLWVDDIRTPPSDDWLWARSVNQAITAIKCYERSFTSDTIYINLDHDAGDFAKMEEIISVFLIGLSKQKS